MKRMIVPVLIAVSALLTSGCSSTAEFTEPTEARERAKWMRAEASGFRKDAREYALVMAGTQEKIEKQQIRLDVLQERLERIEMRLRAGRESASGDEGGRKTAHQRAMENYTGRRTVVLAQLDETTVTIRKLRAHHAQQSTIHGNMLRKAEMSEMEAQGYEEQAALAEN